MPRTMRMLSWNTLVKAHWSQLTSHDGVDVALLPKAVPPPTDVVVETVR
ncbi:MAG: hypothetical protein AB7P22_00755 [Vicinamibacterales bacterium]